MADSYDDQVPEVVADLAEAAEAMASELDAVMGSQWQRLGRRGDGASFSVGTIARYMVHDPIHHVWDVSGVPGIG